jgi:hypothetical protein
MPMSDGFGASSTGCDTGIGLSLEGVMTSVADIGSFQRFTSAMPQKLTQAADAGKARKSEDSCGGGAIYLPHTYRWRGL